MPNAGRRLRRYSLRRIEEHIQKKLGVHVDHSTLAGWRQQADLLGLLREQSEAISARAGALVEEALAEIEEEPAKRKWIMQLNAVRGTALDKLIATPTTVSHDHRVMVLLAGMSEEELRAMAERGRHQPPGSIEGGTYRELPDS